MEVELEPEVSGPRPILQLSQDVVNQIAAAEIIHRPSNAIKELLENSLDAGSTSIKVMIKEGGLKSIVISDNGHGIRKDDLPLLCTRFATSKLRAFSDLRSLDTYGFRGEALASISFVSRVNVVTRTAGQDNGWKAYYQDGQLVAAKGAANAEPKPSAANLGTIITAEDLFYNLPSRRRSFRSATDEYHKIIEVINRYAVHNPSVAWTCKKHGGNQPEVSTSSGSTAVNNIALLFGNNLSRELLEFGPVANGTYGVTRIHGYTSGAGYNGKKGTLLLFINNRLVESTKFKRAIETVYTALLPKGSFPFVYLSLDIEPHRVDVNVHPTKSEVYFLDEDAIVELVMSEISKALTNANASRTFTVQSLLPGAPEPNVKRVERTGSNIIKSVAPKSKVRMDAQDRTLESMPMFGKRNPTQLESPYLKRPKLDHSEDDHNRSGTHTGSRKRSDGDKALDLDEQYDTSVNITESSVQLRSIKKLRQLVQEERDDTVNGIIREHIVSGLVPGTTSALIQRGTKLYLVEYDLLADEMFYQLGLRQFGAFGTMNLEPAPSIRQLLDIAIEEEGDLTLIGRSYQDIVKKTTDMLQQRKEMLEEYFAMKIDDDGRLLSLPILLPGFTPTLDRLPFFFLALGTRVNWDEEQACFRTFLQELAYFYSPCSPYPTTVSYEAQEDTTDDDNDDNKKYEYERHQITHVMFPAMKRYANFPSRVLDGVKQLASTDELYKTFERC